MRNRRVTSRDAESTDLFSSSVIFGNVGAGVRSICMISSAPIISFHDKTIKVAQLLSDLLYFIDELPCSSMEISLTEVSQL